MFRQKYRADNEKIKADDALKFYISRKLENGANLRAGVAKRVAVRTAAVALSLVLIGSAVWLMRPAKVEQPIENVSSPVVTQAKTASYEELYEAVKTMRDKTLYNGDLGIDTELKEPSTGSTAPDAQWDSEQNRYSQTNTQVAGVDEADAVKTDGEYLYQIRVEDLIISRLDGAQSAQVARLQSDFAGEKGDYVSIYLWGDRLVVLRTNESNVRRKNMTAEDSDDRMITGAEIYDVTDPASPRKITELWQTGYYLNSRVVDGRLYLFTQDVPSRNCEKTLPETFVPCFGETLNAQANSEPASPKDIRLLADAESNCYVVASAIDIENAKTTSTLSLLGWSGTLYASKENLYWISTDQIEEGSALRDCTRIMRIHFENGILTLTGEAEVPGDILNQFSCDEFEGYFRLVTTTNHYETVEYSAASGPEGSSIVTKVKSESENNLYILDSDLNLAGKIEGLAKGEQVYSVRFLGDVAYFVTFREIDPLFSADLSDPSAPKIMGELKIPGFSSYLHPYSENLLFGFGYSTNAKGSQTEHLKLSMFDTSDPYAVKESHTLEIDATCSDATYNHKAILIDSTLNLIAFPVNDSYQIYGYSAEDGFYLRKEVSFGDTWQTLVPRSIYSGDYFYVCSENGLGIYNLADLSPVGQMEYTANPSHE